MSYMYADIRTAVVKNTDKNLDTYQWPQKLPVLAHCRAIYFV